MGIEERVYAFHDIVPIVPEPSWAERKLPASLLRLGRRFGYFRPPARQEQQCPGEYPGEMMVQMPEIPASAGYDGVTPRPFVYLLDRVGEIVERMSDAPGQQRKLTLRMSRRSFEDFYGDIPARGDDNWVGDAMFALMAVSEHADERLGRKGYRVLSAGAGSNYDGISLQVQKV